MHTHRNIHVNEREKEEKSIKVDNYIWENKIILILQNKMVNSLAAASLFTCNSSPLCHTQTGVSRTALTSLARSSRHIRGTA